MKGMTIIVKKIAQFITPMMFLYGFFIVIHGHLTPGGGFAGGVIMAGAFIIQILAYGDILAALRKREAGMEFMESSAIFIFLVIAALGLMVRGSLVFFTNFMNKGVVGELISAGIIPIINLAVGAEVCAAMAAIFIALTVFSEEVSQ